MNKNKERLNHQPPKLSNKLLAWFCKDELHEEILGDLQEYHDDMKHLPNWKKKLFYWFHLINFIRPFAIKKTKTTTNMSMLKSYIKIGWRQLMLKKVTSSVKIGGLALGMVVFFLILLYHQYEYSIDRYHSKADRIFRVYEKTDADEEGGQYQGLVSHMLAGALEAEFPEIELTANMIFLGTNTLRFGDNLFREKNYTAVSPAIFKIWDFEILEGDPSQMPRGAAGLVLTESGAKRLFGDEPALGKYVYSHQRFGEIEVVGIIKDMPDNSTFQFNSIYVTNYEQWGSLSFFNERWLKLWDERIVTTWVLLKENAVAEAILENKDRFLEKYYDEEIRHKHDFFLQNIQDLHLDHRISTTIQVPLQSHWLLIALTMSTLSCWWAYW